MKLILPILALIFTIANTQRIWRLNRPSLFEKEEKVNEIEGSDIEYHLNLSKEAPQLLFLYHPDCPDSQKSAPEWIKLSRLSEIAKLPV